MNIQLPQDSQAVESQALLLQDSQPVEDFYAPGLAAKVDTEDQDVGKAMREGEGENGEEEPMTDDEVVEPVISHELADLLEKQETEYEKREKKDQEQQPEQGLNEQQEDKPSAAADTTEGPKQEMETPEHKPPTPAEATDAQKQSQGETTKGEQASATPAEEAQGATTQGEQASATPAEVATAQQQQPQEQKQQSESEAKEQGEKQQTESETKEQGEQTAVETTLESKPTGIPNVPPLSPIGVHIESLDSDEEDSKPKKKKAKKETTSKGTHKDNGQFISIELIIVK